MNLKICLKEKCEKVLDMRNGTIEFQKLIRFYYILGKKITFFGENLIKVKDSNLNYSFFRKIEE